MKFRIIAQCFQNASGIPNSQDIDFLLEQDKWDDYGFHTLYHVHASSKLTGTSPEYLGSINIMRKGQQKNEYYLVFKEMQGNFEQLSDNFCSISMSVELYRGLARILKTAEERIQFARSLRMIFSKDSPIYPEFKNEPCFNTSLLRNASMDAYGLKFGKEIMLGETSDYDLARIPLKYTLPGNHGEVDFEFGSGNLDLEEKMDIPSRLLACIGNNGSGKSTILYRLARILFATPSARSAFADTLGVIAPSDAGFTRLFVISYSAFDNFVMPGINVDDFKLILDGIRNKNGRFVFCGIRDLDKEYSEQINQSEAKAADSTEIDWSGLLDKDHRDFHRLKTIDSLANEFEYSYNHISTDDSKRSYGTA